MLQGTVLGPILFSLMVNNKQFADPRRNLMVKFADNITISIPVSKDSTDVTINEVDCMNHWAASNRMTLNLSKTWENVIHGKTTKPFQALSVRAGSSCLILCFKKTLAAGMFMSTN